VGAWVCTNSNYPPLPGFPGGNVWISDHDLSDDQGVTCSQMTTLQLAKWAYRGLKWFELLLP